MRTIIVASALLTTALAAPALAGDPGSRCASEAAGRVVATSKVSKGLEDLGYRVSRIKTEHGCYEIWAVNDSSFPIKAIYARATGELVQARLR